MVKTRRSNGENGEVDDGNYTVNDVGSVSDEKVMHPHTLLCVLAWCGTLLCLEIPVYESTSCPHFLIGY